MKGKKIRFRRVSFFFLMLIIPILCALAFYNGMLKNNLTKYQKNTLSEILVQNKFNFDSEIKSEQILMESLAGAFSEVIDNPTLILEMLKNIQEHTNFESMAVVNVNGKGIATNGQEVDVSNHNCFQGALSGKSMFSESVESLLLETEVIHLAMPIYDGEEIVGVLVSAYEVGKLNRLLLSSFSGKGYAFIVNKEGDILSRTENDYVLINRNNLFAALKSANFIEDDTLQEIVTKVQSGQSGKTTYELNGQVRYAQFQKLDMVEWHIFTVVPQEVIGENMRPIMGGTLLLTSCIIGLFVCFIVYILVLQKRALKEETRNRHMLERVAYYDELTGVPNLNKFKIDTQKILESNLKIPYVAIKFDIVNFKMINEMFDFEVGNEIIRQIAFFLETIITSVAKETGVLTAFARVNGDEFILLDIASTAEESEARRMMFESVFHEHMAPILGKHQIVFRYGRYFLEIDEANVSDMLEKVNIAHRMAKEQMNSIVCDYKEAFLENFVKETKIANDMERALQQKEFQVYLQPKYDTKTGSIVGGEALVRWIKQDGTILYPGDFIPLFERNGFIVKLDFYMFEEVNRLILKWMEKGLPLYTISVNFSRLHLENPTFVEDIYEITNRYNVPTKYLEIELTESIVFNNEDMLTSLLKRLHECGFRLSMDDFGTGYSSLGLLKNLSVDVIKMDRSFFDSNNQGERAQIVLESVVNMAQNLKIYTVAEGVETQNDVTFLQKIGCDSVQGYYYAKPMPVSEYEKLLK